MNPRGAESAALLTCFMSQEENIYPHYLRLTIQREWETIPSGWKHTNTHPRADPKELDMNCWLWSLTLCFPDTQMRGEAWNTGWHPVSAELVKMRRILMWNLAKSDQGTNQLHRFGFLAFQIKVQTAACRIHKVYAWYFEEKLLVNLLHLMRHKSGKRVVFNPCSLLQNIWSCSIMHSNHLMKQIMSLNFMLTLSVCKSTRACCIFPVMHGKVQSRKSLGSWVETAEASQQDPARFIRTRFHMIPEIQNGPTEKRTMKLEAGSSELTSR